ncbi:unnamed protein product [Polarella glacialis]|uniref:Uncharacterized protein n=1 Tax=Polarella glacialis TaxID=89957 RepID=A0A813DDK8_POLGL|nr:unnamed protein product [Polarella glacialis]
MPRSFFWTEAGRLIIDSLAQLAPIPVTRGGPCDNITASVLQYASTIALNFWDCCCCCCCCCYCCRSLNFRDCGGATEQSLSCAYPSKPGNAIEQKVVAVVVVVAVLVIWYLRSTVSTDAAALSIFSRALAVEARAISRALVSQPFGLKASGESR